MGKWRDRWELNEGGIVRFLEAVSPQNMFSSFNKFHQRLCCFEHIFFLSLLLKDRKVKNRDVNQDKQKDHNERIPYIL